MVRRVLFDVDGVLLDSEVAYRAIWARWALDHGLFFDSLWPLLQGRRARDAIGDVAPHLDLVGELEVLRALLREEQDHLMAMPGALGLLSALEPGTWALVTSNEADVIRGQFARLGLPQPEVVVGGSDVPRGKPDPIPFLWAAARLGSPPGDCLVVEDSPAGIAAGLRAGMAVLGIASSHGAHELARAHVVELSLAAAAPRITAWVGSPGLGLTALGSAQPLDEHGHPHAAAHAHGLQADGAVQGAQPIEQGAGDPGTGHPKGVAERD